MKIIKTTCLYCLLFLSEHLIAQSPGGILHPSVWLKGNFSSDLGGPASLNFNPAVALDKRDASIKLPDNLESLRRVTIFTVYQDSLTNKEKQVWEMTGEFGDLLLSTNHVSSKNKKTNIAFEKRKLNTPNPKSESIIHSYSSHNAGGSASKEFKYKKPSIRFGQPVTSESAVGSLKLIAEFILYKKILNEKETTKIETYLALKYGITLEKNYLDASGKTVWNCESDFRFSNNIAGIGRDDQSSLFQKQSTSCTSTEQLVIGVNKIVHSNSENTGELNDGDYLIWGDNGESFVTPNAIAAANQIMLSEKKWLMKASGGSSNKISTEIKFDTRTFLPGKFPAKNFYLVIDRSGSTDFRPENCSYITPDQISTNGMATFTNILWDTDGSGKDNFTFGFNPAVAGLSPRLQSNIQSAVKSEHDLNQDGLLSFQVFPNPVSDGNYQVAIKLHKPTDIKINIYDLTQQLIFSREESGQDSYQLSDHINGKPGAYIIQLITPQTEFYRMMIIQ